MPKTAKKRASPSSMFHTFYNKLFALMLPEDQQIIGLSERHEIASHLWKNLQQRKRGDVKVNVYCPSLKTHGWQSAHSILEVINDDMPFLVDSLTGLLNRSGFSVQQVFHPIVHVKRTRAGKIQTFSAEPEQDTQPESVIHFQFDYCDDAARLKKLSEDALGILDDVRCAVSDWSLMKQKTAETVAELAAMPQALFPQEDVAETQAFMNWLADNNFTFLGYREIYFPNNARDSFEIVSKSGLGILRDPQRILFNQMRKLSAQPPEVQRFFNRKRLILVLKTNMISSVHRSVPMDAIFVKRYDKQGREISERIYVGLFTSSGYMRIPREVPILRLKIRNVMARSGFDPVSHDGKTLTHILDNYPRDELFQINHEDLYRNSMGILHLQERQHLALFMRQDSFGRFVTCLIYVPRDNYDTSLREKFRHIIESELNGTQTTFTTRIDDQRLARVFAVIHLKNGMPKGFSQERLEKKLREAARAWPDRLRECLIEKQGITIGSALHQKYAHSFPSAYTAHFRPEHAVNDILQISKMPRGQNLIADLIADDDNKQAVHLRVYHRGKPLELSSVMPIIENMGLMAESETGPFAVIDKDEKIFVHSFKAKLQGDSTIDLTAIHDEFLKTFVSVWQGHQDNDTFNQLILLAGMTGRQVVLVRALSRYLKQIRAPHSLISITHTLVKHAQLSQLLLKLFELRHSPAITSQARKQFSKIRAEFMAGLAKVPTLDEDRILRRLLNLIEAAMRTNFYQDNAPALAIKFDCAAVENMPLPRMKYEIFVHSSLVEGIHLRGGKVARGGIRWSDREDFRTEILGLVKAQMVKNAVIVPVGSKGGFVVRQKLSADHYQDGITCYQIYIRSLLSLTDNLVKGKIIPPKQVLRHDGDDPYLVVAADKGTAKFSDIANTISQEHGFWLDDAFASGGSVGYDHKEMGITARGAWESVKRHFREMGHDTQSQNFTVMGVGDMSGDVFGNGMLLSKHIRLLGAFDHRHIFCDPNPDAAKSFKERERMFHLPKSSWANYHAKLISKGGGIFSRQEKSIRITPEMKAAYDIGAETLSPQDLINAMLKAPVDLLYLGGIGTYVKASTETHEQVDDRANDSLRVNAKELRAKVVAEGANLGCTQRARIEFAKLGGRINTDAIDNSAGVDTSDHEVNIKIAFAPSLISAKLKRPARNKLLRDMTDDVAKLVLRDNYLQTQALTVAQLRGNELVHLHARTIAALEKTGLLNRQVEFLPDEEELSARMRDGQTLTRPELAVLLAYAKIWLFDQLLASNLPDDPWLKGDLLRYFPKKMSDKFSRDIAQHQLAREIIATSITNSFINRAGSQFVFRAMEKTGQNAVAVTRAYVIARDSYQLVSYWRAIESLDNVAPAAVQAELFLYTERLLSYVVPWILRETKVTQPFEKQIDDLGSACQKMRTWLDENTPVSAKVNASQLIAQKVPEPLAKTAALIPLLSAAPDVHWLSQKYNVSIAQGSALFFSVGDRFNFSWLREKCRASAQNTQWQRDAISGLIEDLFITQRMLCGKILSSHRKQWHDPAAWFAGSTRLQAIDHTMNELRHSTAIDFAGLALMARQLGLLAKQGD